MQNLRPLVEVGASKKAKAETEAAAELQITEVERLITLEKKKSVFKELQKNDASSSGAPSSELQKYDIPPEFEDNGKENYCEELGNNKRKYEKLENKHSKLKKKYANAKTKIAELEKENAGLKTLVIKLQLKGEDHTRDTSITSTVAKPMLSAKDQVYMEKGMVHIGLGIFCTKNAWDQMIAQSTPSLYVKEMAVAIFSTITLAKSSVEGKICNKLKNSGKEVIAKPPLSPEKVTLLKAHLRDHLVLLEYPEKAIGLELKNVTKYLNEKCSSAARRVPTSETQICL